jgi:hypothetical protein
MWRCPTWAFQHANDSLSRRIFTVIGVKNEKDWGATLGLTLPVDPAFCSRLDRLFVMNTVLPVGEPLSSHFYEWRSVVRKTPDLPVGQSIRTITPQLTDEETVAYDAPFPDSPSRPGFERSQNWLWLSPRWRESPNQRRLSS